MAYKKIGNTWVYEGGSVIAPPPEPGESLVAPSGAVFKATIQESEYAKKYWVETQPTVAWTYQGQSYTGRPSSDNISDSDSSHPTIIVSEGIMKKIEESVPDKTKKISTITVSKGFFKKAEEATQQGYLPSKDIRLETTSAALVLPAESSLTPQTKLQKIFQEARAIYGALPIFMYPTWRGMTSPTSTSVEQFKAESKEARQWAKQQTYGHIDPTIKEFIKEKPLPAFAIALGGGWLDPFYFAYGIKAYEQEKKLQKLQYAKETKLTKYEILGEKGEKATTEFLEVQIKPVNEIKPIAYKIFEEKKTPLEKTIYLSSQATTEFISAATIGYGLGQAGIFKVISKPFGYASLKLSPYVAPKTISFIGKGILAGIYGGYIGSAAYHGYIYGKKEGAIFGGTIAAAQLYGLSVGATEGRTFFYQREHFHPAPKVHVSTQSILGKPILTKVTSPTGTIRFIGMPKPVELANIFYPEPTPEGLGYWTPTSKTQLAFYKNLLKIAPPEYQQLYSTSYGLGKEIYGRRVPGEIRGYKPELRFEKGVMGKFPQKTQRAWIEYEITEGKKATEFWDYLLRQQRLERIYGSSAIESQGGFEAYQKLFPKTALRQEPYIYRDVDKMMEGLAKIEAKKIVAITKASGTPARIIGVAQVEARLPSGEWVKIYDIHGKDVPELLLEGKPLGFKPLSPRLATVKGKPTIIDPLSQEYINKFVSSMAMGKSKSGQIILSPTPERYPKDIADMISIAAKFEGMEKIEPLKQQAISIYGEELLKKTTISSITPSYVMPSPSYAILPSISLSLPKIKTSATPSNKISKISSSISQSISPPISKSVSNISSSISKSLSPSISSFSISPASYSPSISLSPSISKSTSMSSRSSISKNFANMSPTFPNLPSKFSSLNFDFKNKIFTLPKMKTSREYTYTPSSLALVFKITGKKTKARFGGAYSGFELRKIPKSFSWKKLLEI